MRLSRVVRKSPHTITGYGTVVLRSQKEEFKTKVDQLIADVAKFASEVQANLQTEMDKNRKNLVKAMLLLVRRTTPKDWIKSDGKKPDAVTPRQFLDDELRRAFGTAEQLVSHMQVKLVFKGVTFELLSDDKFREAAKHTLPGFAKLYREFDAAKAVQEGKSYG